MASHVLLTAPEAKIHPQAVRSRVTRNWTPCTPGKVNTVIHDVPAAAYGTVVDVPIASGPGHFIWKIIIELERPGICSQQVAQDMSLMSNLATDLGDETTPAQGDVDVAYVDTHGRVSITRVDMKANSKVFATYDAVATEVHSFVTGECEFNAHELGRYPDVEDPEESKQEAIHQSQDDRVLYITPELPCQELHNSFPKFLFPDTTLVLHFGEMQRQYVTSDPSSPPYVFANGVCRPLQPRDLKVRVIVRTIELPPGELDMYKTYLSIKDGRRYKTDVYHHASTLIPALSEAEQAVVNEKRRKGVQCQREMMNIKLPSPGMCRQLVWVAQDTSLELSKNYFTFGAEEGKDPIEAYELCLGGSTTRYHGSFGRYQCQLTYKYAPCRHVNLHSFEDSPEEYDPSYFHQLQPSDTMRVALEPYMGPTNVHVWAKCVQFVRVGLNKDDPTMGTIDLL